MGYKKLSHFSIFLFCAGRKYCVWWKGRNGYFWHNVNEPIEAI